MRVIARIRRMGADGLPVEPVELDRVDAEAADYPTARDLTASKVPDGWQLLDWFVPEHHEPPKR